jgi:hypothetical protein
MEPQGREALTAWRIFRAIEKLSNLLFDRYHEEFQEFYSEEMEDREREDFFLRPRLGLVPGETGGEAKDAPPSFPWEADG